jgi:carbon storage regulator
MLVLTRKVGEEIIIGEGIRVRVVSIKGSHIRLGFEAPADVRILRPEMIGRKGPAPQGPPPARRRDCEQQT